MVKQFMRNKFNIESSQENDILLDTKNTEDM